MSDDDGTPPSGVSRRALLGAAGVGAVALGATAATGFAIGRAEGSGSTSSGVDEGPDSKVYRYTGRHQAGIVTPSQDRLHFAAFDLTATSRDALIALLVAWTDAARRMTSGDPAGMFGPVDGPYEAPPDDTGEAQGLDASGLTITIGFGPTLFSSNGADRYGVAAARPAALIDLPHFPGDTLVPTRTGGDLCIQACAHDPQVAVHAIRNMARLAFGKASVRWSQLGFGRTSSTSTAQETPRNLFGFKDGTANIKAEDTDAVRTHLWVAADDDAASPWMTDGTYLVARRINMQIETWDRGSLHEQEAIVGRSKGEGAPLSGGTEFTEPDFARMGSDDQPLIPVDAHVRLAHPDQNAGARLLRRGYNFTDGSDGLGRLDAGLFFLAYMRDPVTQYVPMQTTLARDDAMAEYLRHTGSGIFAIPPGVGEDGYVGQTLLEA